MPEEGDSCSEPWPVDRPQSGDQPANKTTVHISPLRSEGDGRRLPTSALVATSVRGGSSAVGLGRIPVGRIDLPCRDTCRAEWLAPMSALTSTNVGATAPSDCPQRIEALGSRRLPRLSPAKHFSQSSFRPSLRPSTERVFSAHFRSTRSERMAGIWSMATLPAHRRTRFGTSCAGRRGDPLDDPIICDRPSSLWDETWLSPVAEGDVARGSLIYGRRSPHGPTRVLRVAQCRNCVRA